MAESLPLSPPLLEESLEFLKPGEKMEEEEEEWSSSDDDDREDREFQIELLRTTLQIVLPPKKRHSRSREELKESEQEEAVAQPPPTTTTQPSALTNEQVVRPRTNQHRRSNRPRFQNEQRNSGRDSAHLPPTNQARSFNNYYPPTQQFDPFQAPAHYFHQQAPYHHSFPNPTDPFNPNIVSMYPPAGPVYMQPSDTPFSYVEVPEMPIYHPVGAQPVPLVFPMHLPYHAEPDFTAFPIPHSDTQTGFAAFPMPFPPDAGPGFTAFAMPHSESAEGGFAAFPMPSSEGAEGGFTAFPANPPYGAEGGVAAFPMPPSEGAEGGFTAFPMPPSDGTDNGFTRLDDEQRDFPDHYPPLPLIPPLPVYVPPGCEGVDVSIKIVTLTDPEIPFNRWRMVYASIDPEDGRRRLFEYIDSEWVEIERLFRRSRID